VGIDRRVEDVQSHGNGTRVVLTLAAVDRMDAAQGAHFDPQWR
jgi:anti-anti-sigma regulatory factor